MLLQTNKPRRPGYAPLELVLSLPFLVVLAAMIFTIAGAAVTRGNVAVQARNDAWQEVPNQPGKQLAYWGSTPASGTPIITASPDATVGLVHRTSSAQVKSFAGKALPGGQTASSENSVLRQSWDYRSIPIVAKEPLLPSDQLYEYIKDDLNFLTNWNNLKYVIEAVNPKINGVSLRDLETLVQDIKDIVQDTKDIVNDLNDAIKSLKGSIIPPKVPNPVAAASHIGDLIGKLPDLISKSADAARIVAQIEQALNGGDSWGSGSAPSDSTSISPAKIVKMIKGLKDEVLDGIKNLPDAITGIADLIDKLVKTNDY